MSQPVFMGEMLQHSEHFHHLLWACSNTSISFVGNPQAQCISAGGVLTRAEQRGENHLPWPADLFYTAHNIVHFLATGKVYIQFIPKSFLMGMPLFNLCSSLLLGSFNPGAGPCAWLVELHDIYVELLLKPIRASLDGIPSLTQISCPTHQLPSSADLLGVHSIPGPCHWWRHE